MKKKNDLIWSISLIILSVAAIVLAGSNVVGLKLPDAAVRIIGMIDIVALPFFVFSTIKKGKTDRQ